MKLTIAGFATLLIFSASTLAYDSDDLKRDAQSHYRSFISKHTDLTVRVLGGSDETVSYIKSDKWREEINWGVLVKLFDGKNTWMYDNGTKKKLTDVSAFFNPLTFFGFWTQPGDSFEITGSETVDNHDCWVVVEQRPDGDYMKYWVDKKCFAYVKGEEKYAGKILYYEYSDFQTVENDFVIPFHYELSSEFEEDGTEDTEIKSIETDIGLSDSLFDAAELPGKEQ
jgi:outer membrane lipoprotein-sorting protein